MRKVVPHGYRFAQPILRDYGVADRIVFNMKGNDYRLVTSVDFEQGIVWGGVSEASEAWEAGGVSDLP